MTCIGTLVERATRYVMLFPLLTGHTAELVRVALAKKIRALPLELRRSLTWDQGHEMAQHAGSRLTQACRSTSAIRNHHGSAVVTKTPTGFSASTCLRPPICRK